MIFELCDDVLVEQQSGDSGRGVGEVPVEAGLLDQVPDHCFGFKIRLWVTNREFINISIGSVPESHRRVLPIFGPPPGRDPAGNPLQVPSHLPALLSVPCSSSRCG